MTNTGNTGNTDCTDEGVGFIITAARATGETEHTQRAEHTEHTEHTEETENTEHSGYIEHTEGIEYTEHTEHIKHTEHIEQTECIDHMEHTGHTADTERHEQFHALTVLFATGVTDRFPTVPGLRECLGLTVYVCPDCDGYEVRNRRTIVLGAGDTGAQMALTLYERTQHLIYINHDYRSSPVSKKVAAQLQAKAIEVQHEQVVKVLTVGDGQFQGVELADGRVILAERAFIAFGGNKVHSTLLKQLGVERFENEHIPTELRSKMTNVDGVWAIGDIGLHAEQVAIAIGEGSQAAIWIHKTIMTLQK
ncbi:NAD(P)/FAD-dependent oxidoreductase [Paenibacillus sp. 481]|nr:NAD(P)/FAD-dependent oxidoreductase [Paenibacillus sp. 481]